MQRGHILGMLGAMLLAACGGGDKGNPAPPRVTTPAVIPQMVSHMAVPLSMSITDIERTLEEAVPATLWSIDQQEKACVPAVRLTLCLKHVRPCKGDACKDVPCRTGFKKAKITPDLSCRVVGQVTRGKISVTGEGGRLRVTMPVRASVSARDVGKLLSETADGAAEVKAWIRLGVGKDWHPTAKLDVDYGWTEKPGIEILGKRFTFAGKADPKLAAVVARLERDLPPKLRKLNMPQQVEKLWHSGFTVLTLNARNPPVWLRVTPQQLGVGDFHFDKGQAVVTLGLVARTETFLGDKPPAAAPTPLPPAAAVGKTSGFRFALPVVADYRELVPVLEEELAKLATRPIAVPAVGDVKVRFGSPTIYTTQGGKIAIGLPIAARAHMGLIATRGTVWLTGRPVNQPGSQRVEVKELAIAGDQFDLKGNILMRVAQSPAVLAGIARALGQDFSRDFGKLKAKVDKALSDKRVGDLVLDATIEKVMHGVVQPVGQGLYLPVEAQGVASLRFDPLPEAK